ncbi:MAG: 3,4-dihydroxy-2-butanone-4-phosphate synthase [Hyphomicrobiaceae bacterium]|nr:3,4-dihydroxy-2-butanone-4-phosphate synthase [Hyphomicrobiaceae bacterium]
MSRGSGIAVFQEGRGFLSSTDEIVEDLRNGRMVVLVDAEDRENEGDLVASAQMATPDTINFMAKHGRGLICLTLTEARASELNLKAMTRTNASRNRTAFTQSIEAREGISTGISAGDRARTIATAIDPSKSADDIVSPGHVFPLVAREGGVLIRAGHTEASVDLARLAGLQPAAVICEIMNDDGTMARMPDLVPFAQRHGLKIGTIEDLIAYRLRNDTLVHHVARRQVESAHGGAFDMHVYAKTVDGAEHLALVKGDVSKGGPVLVRVHAVNALQDLLGVGAAADGTSQIGKAMQLIADEGRGVIVLIRDLGATTISDWVAQQKPSVPETNTSKGRERRQVEVGVGSQILRDLGVTDMILLTNTDAPVYVGVEAFGLHIVGTRRIE